MFEDLSPIEQLDTVLTYMTKDSSYNVHVDYLRKEFDIKNFRVSSEIINRLQKDGYADVSTANMAGQSWDVYNITFDGRLFQSLGGYQNQQKQLEELSITNARNESQRASYERRLLWGTWFAGLSAALVLLWYIFLWFCPHPYDCFCTIF